MDLPPGVVLITQVLLLNQKKVDAKNIKYSLCGYSDNVLVK